jgi:hypothetical protein
VPTERQHAKHPLGESVFAVHSGLLTRTIIQGGRVPNGSFQTIKRRVAKGPILVEIARAAVRHAISTHFGEGCRMGEQALDETCGARSWT